MKKIFPQLTSIFLGFTFWGAGMVKLYAGHQFIGWIGPPWLVERLQEYELGLFAEFIAVSQITIGFMLLSTRFKLLGSIMMIPMILNILMVTVSQNWAGTPYVLAVLLLMNLYILWQYRDFFGPLVDEGKNGGKLNTRKEKSRQGHLVWLAGWSLQLISIPISFQNLTIAFSTAAIGLILAILSFKVDTRFTRKIETHP
ncbi:hypothetical protein [Algoriphagus sp.]|uniref:hypothetical protein n=1 Tax=Algoriphagus sp. TaxID=1872435 RepID=UPI00272648B6|nr:hypothetical protein [Algoriphagus sp.]MDO8967104.1 hypothetical protein [Algoriphagus sp.]MDP3199402.1 hypothetical protein [Algoriphagus sp.]